jgi:two-component system response regulator FlrC
VNCAALPESLLESELFGHEKGTFTGAVGRKKGKFEQANGGCLLLDEISEMDVSLQAKLLRVLQEREVDRVGGGAPVPVDVKVLATTNRDLDAMIESGEFREDLYYRINVVPLHVPPLRERREDIPLLSDFFIRKYNRIDNRDVKGLTQESLSLLMNRSWKGNVRELENTIQRAVLMCEGPDITCEDFTMPGNRPIDGNTAPVFTPGVSLKEMEKNIIFSTLDHTNDNRTHAAQMLGISVRTLRNKLNEYKEKMAVQ